MHVKQHIRDSVLSTVEKIASAAALSQLPMCCSTISEHGLNLKREKQKM